MKIDKQKAKAFLIKNGKQIRFVVEASLILCGVFGLGMVKGFTKGTQYTEARKIFGAGYRQGNLDLECNIRKHNPDAAKIIDDYFESKKKENSTE